MNRNWLLNRTNDEFLHYLSRRVTVSPVFAQVLVNRGMKDVESIRAFLNPSITHLHDPFLMPDMKNAVKRAMTAIEKGERILIHGDYDADGITSTVLMVSALNRLGATTCYHIPNRITEGYGLSSKGLEKAVQLGATLIITVDCGITSEDEVSKAASSGIDVIVTDHHEPPGNLPKAAAVIDPHRKDSAYPFKYLAGVGVAFKFIQAIVEETGRGDIQMEDMLDLVALGTIADSVPLVGENRVFVTHGLRKINEGAARTGIQALKDVSRVNGGSRAGGLSYSLIPRINAAGRLDDAGEVVELFLTEDRDRANTIAARLEEQNKKRRKIESDVLNEALDMINADELESSIILSSEGWHPGVIGIVASRLAEMFYRPVFLFSVTHSVAKGSARGIPPLHLYDAIDGCSDLLLGYGGHRQAAGLRLAFENMDPFKERMNRIVDASVRPEEMTPVLEIDAAVRFSDLNFSLIKELELLEPFGDSNREPLFGAKSIEVVNHGIVGNNHLKLWLKQESCCMDTIGFSMGNSLKNIQSSSHLDIAFVPWINEWNGSKSIQLNLKAIRPSRE